MYQNHANLTGVHLHKPLGDVRAGALTLAASQAQAYLIESDANEILFELDTSNGEITLGNLTEDPTIRLDTATPIRNSGRGVILMSETTATDFNAGYWFRTGSAQWDGVVYDEDVQADGVLLARVTSEPDDSAAYTISTYVDIHLKQVAFPEDSTTPGSGRRIYAKSDNKLYYYDGSSETDLTAGGGGGGDVSGPGSSTDNAIARFSGAGGGTIQDSGCTISDDDLTIVYNDDASTTAENHDVRWKGGDGSAQCDAIFTTDHANDRFGFSAYDQTAGGYKTLNFHLGDPSQTTANSVTRLYMYTGTGVGTRFALFNLDTGGNLFVSATAAIVFTTIPTFRQTSGGGTHTAVVDNSSGGDAAIKYEVGGTDWYVGLDSSSNFQINNAALETEPLWLFDTDGHHERKPDSVTQCRRYDEFGSATTTDAATAETLHTISVPTDHSAFVRVEIAGYGPDGAAAATVQVAVENDSGTVTISNDQIESHYPGGSTYSTFEYGASVSGTDVLITVQGEDTDTVLWRSYATVLEMEYSI